jgi:hypothetical protein
MLKPRGETIAVSGLKPLIRDFSRLSKTLTKSLREELRAIAGPVEADVKAREEQWGEKEAAGVRTVVRQRGIAVEQALRRVTGKRGDFGALQMKRAFLPGLRDNQAAVEAGVSDFLNRLTTEASGGAT